MSIEELAREARKLPFDELQELTRELDATVAERLDKQLEAAVEAGHFDRLAEEAVAEYRAGKTKPLDEVLDDESVS